MGQVTFKVEAENIQSEEIEKQVLALLHYLEITKPELVVTVKCYKQRGPYKRRGSG